MLWYQLLERLETMHRRGYTHADIKPENMLLADEYSGLLKLCDFGVAQLF